MKILISSYWPLGNTGYGNQTFLLAQELLKYDHQIFLIAWDIVMTYSPGIKTLIDLYGSTLPHILKAHPEKITTISQIKYLLPPQKPSPKKNIRPDLNQILDPLIKEFQINRIILLHDLWPFLIQEKLSVPSYLWLPIHSTKLEKETKEQLNYFDCIVAPSQFCFDVLSSYHPRTELIYHLIPFPKFQKSQKEIRNQLFNFIGNSFLVTMVARNSEPNDRKAFRENLEGFSKFFQKRSKEEQKQIYLYLHTNWNGAISIEPLLKEIPVSQLIKPDQKKYQACLYSQDYLNQIYQASNLLLSASCAEGFGLPLIEAQMRRCPVLTNSSSAMIENTYYGYLVGNLENKDWIRPDPKKISKALDLAFESYLKKEKKNLELLDQKLKNKFDPSKLGCQWNNLIME